MSKSNSGDLFDYYLKKDKEKRISESEKKQWKFLLNIYHLLKRFEIAIQYLNKDKIQAEVEEMFPAWSGYENQFFIFSHYETYGNCLYAYDLAWANFLRELFRINKKGKLLAEIVEDPKLQMVSDIIKSFVENEAVLKIISERHSSVHIYGKWRFEFDENMTQDWTGLISKLKGLIEEVESVRKKYHDEMLKSIFKQVVLPK